MTITQEQATWFADTFARLSDNIGLAVLGKGEVIRLVLTAMLAEGHVLLEDAPAPARRSWPRHWPVPSRAPTAGSSSLRIYCPPTSPA